MPGTGVDLFGEWTDCFFFYLDMETTQKSTVYVGDESSLVQENIACPDDA